jgi:hypothetical protein
MGDQPDASWKQFPEGTIDHMLPLRSHAVATRERDVFATTLRGRFDECGAPSLGVQNCLVPFLPGESWSFSLQ